MSEAHDQHRDHRSGKYTRFNRAWYDELRASKPDWIWDTGIPPQERPPWTDWRPAFKARLERLKAAGHTGATGRYYGDDRGLHPRNSAGCVTDDG